jgi:hypothetical protein
LEVEALKIMLAQTVKKVRCQTGPEWGRAVARSEREAKYYRRYLDDEKV